MVRRSALMAAAALAIGSLSTQTARATTVFDSNSFSSTAGYTTGSNLYNQPAAGQAFGSLGTNSTTAHSTVTAGAGTGVTVGDATNNAAVVTWTAADGDVGYSPLYAVPPLATPGNNIVAIDGPLVTVSTDISYTSTGADPSTVDGPFLGLRLVGNNGAALLGGVGVDATSGELVLLDPTTGYNIFAGDPTLAAGTYAHLTVALNFTTGSVTETVSGPVSAMYSSTFSASSFYAGYLFGGSTGGTDPTSATAAFDNYVITATGASSVPEPASLGLLGVAGVALLGRRTRRFAVVA